MPQVFQVLRCYSCSTFQVHQVKKVAKWNCKLCGEKQSTKKVYGQGSGADCRKHVQKLNMMRGDIEEHVAEHYSTSEKSQEPEDEFECDQKPRPNLQGGKASGSKWEKYIEVEQEDLNVTNNFDELGNYTTEKSEFVAVCRQNRKASRERYHAYRNKHQLKNGSSPFLQKPQEEDMPTFTHSMHSRSFPGSQVMGQGACNQWAHSNDNTPIHRLDTANTTRNQQPFNVPSGPDHKLKTNNISLSRFNDNNSGPYPNTGCKKNKPVPQKPSVPMSSKWAKFVEEKSDDSDDDDNDLLTGDAISVLSGFSENPESKPSVNLNEGVAKGTSTITSLTDSSMPNFSLGEDLEDLIGI